jgi:lipopolysaccharide/colanic/teichoic acid biosynthesis glycosyltransferase
MLSIHSGEVHLNADLLVASNFENRAMNRAAQFPALGKEDLAADRAPARIPSSAPHFLPYLVVRQLSPWSRSRAKRLFDCACVLPALPLLIPVLLAISLAVRMTSAGPAFFLQKRLGLHGRSFTILKFRTMFLAADKAHPAVTTAGNQRFTPIGPFLRRWKLDELPQLLNVLRGEMSLVGPRPKMLEHAIADLPCRPGITGAATIAFAREEAVLDRVPRHHLESYYYSVVLPAKRRLDAEYMARATFFSDLKLIVDSVLRRWDCAIIEDLLHSGAFAAEDRVLIPRVSDLEAASAHQRKLPHIERPVSA